MLTILINQLQVPPTFMDGVQIPYVNTAKYLGMILDAKLHWNEEVKIKIIKLQLKWMKLR